MKGRRARAVEPAASPLVEESDVELGHPTHVAMDDDQGSEADLTVGPLIVDAGEEAEAAEASVDVHERDLGRTPPALREVLAEVMAACREAVPGMTEKWINGWKVFTLRSPPPRPHMFGYVSVLVDRVRIGIAAGVEDTHGLFESVKDRKFPQRDVRHLREVRVKGFAELMRQAAEWVPPKKTRRG